MSDNDTPMTVRDIITLLEQIAQKNGDDCTPGIPYSPGHSTIGSSPMMPIIGIHAGFDWDHGRVFITPKERLGPVEVDLTADLQRYQNATGRFIMDLRRALREDTLSDEEKLKLIGDLVTKGPLLAPKANKPKNPGPI